MTNTELSTDIDVMTLVNVFTVAPDRQQELIDLLTEASEEVMLELPGFVSANIHGSQDGERVVNYVQWRSAADYQAMQENPRAIPHMRRAAELGTYDPIVCQVVHTTHA